MARQLLISKEINGEDYHLIKTETEAKIGILQAKLKTSLLDESLRESKIEQYSGTLKSIDVLFNSLNTTGKRKLICSVLPGYITYNDSFKPLWGFAFKCVYNFRIKSATASQAVPDTISERAVISSECKVVIDIEREKGHEITIQQAISVVAFLKELSMLIITEQ